MNFNFFGAGKWDLQSVNPPWDGRLSIYRHILDNIRPGEPGRGEDQWYFVMHSALGFVLQDLPRFPGKGWPLIEAGLQSPVVRNRNTAVKALGAWDRTAWPAAAEPLLRRAIELEPLNDTRLCLKNPKIILGHSQYRER